MGTLLGLATHLARAAATVDRELERHVFEKPCEILVREIKSAIGSYKYSWPSLAASTLAKKGADTPLLERGEFRESFTFRLGHREAWVGSPDKKAAWFEFGTSRMPPRPLLRPALNAAHHDLHASFGGVLRAAVVGRS